MGEFVIDMHCNWLNEHVSFIVVLHNSSLLVIFQGYFRSSHDDVIKRKPLPRSWPFVRGIVPVIWDGIALIMTSLQTGELYDSRRLWLNPK